MTATVDLPTERVPSLGHRRALDGVRAVAVLLVVAYHLHLPYSSRGGSIGVTMFFALSGFLITSLLLTEAAGQGRVRLPAFYARRALRLLPALLVLVPVVSAYALLTGRSDDTVRAVPAVLLYVANWVRAVKGSGVLGMFEHTWSLSVEEQFYLVWPALLVLAGLVVGRRRRPEAVLGLALLGSALSLWWRLRLWPEGDPRGFAPRLYNGTDTAADQLLIGAALAAAVHLAMRHGLRLPGVRRLLLVLGPAALGFLLWVAAFRPGGATVANNRLYLTWGSAVFAAATAVLLAHVLANPRAPLVRLLGTPPLTAIGRVSYGVYLWHYPVILAVDDALPRATAPQRWLLAVTVTALLTSLSWWLVERPALARKQRFTPRVQASDPPVPPSPAASRDGAEGDESEPRPDQGPSPGDARPTSRPVAMPG